MYLSLPVRCVSLAFHTAKQAANAAQTTSKHAKAAAHAMSDRASTLSEALQTERTKLREMEIVCKSQQAELASAEDKLRAMADLQQVLLVLVVHSAIYRTSSLVFRLSAMYSTAG